MTLGAVRHDLRILEDRVTEIEAGREGEADTRSRNSASAFTDEQTKQIVAIVKDQMSLFKLILLSLTSFATLAASLVFAYIKMKGG